MSREAVIRLLAVIGIALGAWWLQANTEWVEEEGDHGAQGEALENPVYAFEHVLRRLGVHAEHHETLDQMPPEHARLVLLSDDWSVIPARAEALHQWVQRGGHLVLLQDTDWDDTPLKSWVHVYAVDAPKHPNAAAAAASAPASAASGPTLISKPALWSADERYSWCALFRSGQRLRAQPGQHPSWVLSRTELESEGLRLPVGQGSVTVLNFMGGSFYNDLFLRCDNAMLLTGAVQAEAGTTVWVYLHEDRESLLPWLWHQGWIAIVAGVLALAALLWRGSLRFGPRVALPQRHRRSIAEQVRGSGAYLWREGREALLLAQQRALEEAAGRHLRGYRQLKPMDRARAVAAATQIAPEVLALAMQSQTCTRAELPGRLHTLETARRQLEKK